MFVLSTSFVHYIGQKHLLNMYLFLCGTEPLAQMAVLLMQPVPLAMLGDAWAQLGPGLSALAPHLSHVPLSLGAAEACAQV